MLVAPAVPHPRTAVGKGIVLMMFGMIYLQKLGLGSGDFQISLAQLLITATVGVMLCTGQATFSRTRLVLFTALIVLMSLSQALIVGPISTASIAFFGSLYGFMLFSWVVSAGEYRAIEASISRLMLLPAAMVFIQYAWQVTAGDGNSIGMNDIVPDAFLVKGYVYESSIPGWRTWDRPNGYFFLEPSFCSLFLAYACWIEFNQLRRWRRAAFFGVALLLCDGATGLLMLAVACTHRFSGSRVAFLLACAGAVAIVLSILSGFGIPLLPRFQELSDESSSGYDRLLRPFMAMFDIASDPLFWFVGEGAGQIPRTLGNAWPFIKLSFEYGVAAAALWLAFLLAAVANAPDRSFLVGLLVIVNVTGGYLLSPIMILFVFLTCTALRIAPAMPLPAPEPARRGEAAPRDRRHLPEWPAEV